MKRLANVSVNVAVPPPLFFPVDVGSFSLQARKLSAQYATVKTIILAKSAI